MAMDAVIVEAAFDSRTPDSLLGQAAKWNFDTLAIVATKGHGGCAYGAPRSRLFRRNRS
jgi:hypothetical protein